MINHIHKIIFIHISKCAGTSVEKAFGIDHLDNTETNNSNLFGWNQKHGLHLQHATPQQLLDYGFVSKQEWETYYKFVIVRNPYGRAVSDYFYMIKDSGYIDSFKNYIFKRGKFKTILNDNSCTRYRGDHLNSQKEYFFLNGEEVTYDLVIRMENIKDGFEKLKQDLKLTDDFFDVHSKKGIKKFRHYSVFYNFYRKQLVYKKFKTDFQFFNYSYCNKKNLVETLKAVCPSVFFIPLKYWKNYIKSMFNK